MTYIGNYMQVMKINEQTNILRAKSGLLSPKTPCMGHLITSQVIRLIFTNKLGKCIQMKKINEQTRFYGAK